MPIITKEGLTAQVHADRVSTRLLDNHIRSARSNPLSGAGAATLTRNGPTMRAIPNPLPSGASAYIPEAIEIVSSASGGPLLLYEAVDMGTVDTATAIYTPGSAFPTRTALGASRQLSGQVVMEFTADMVSQRTVTVTYKNQDGVGGRTSAAHGVTTNVVKNSSGILVLQAGDTAVQEITAVNATGGTSPSGTIQFWGIIQIGRAHV